MNNQQAVCDISSLNDHMLKIMENVEHGLIRLFNHRLTELEERVPELEFTQTIHQQKIETLEDQVEVLEEQNGALQEKYNNLEQNTLRNHLRIFGIPESKDENCVEIVLELFKNKLNIHQTLIVDLAHRVGPTSQKNNAPIPIGDSTVPKSFNHERPRDIIVRFTSRDERQLVLINRKKLKHSGIVIAEDMTFENVRLLKEAKQSDFIKSAWFSNGKIMAERKKDGQMFQISLFPDLDTQLNNLG